jgi:2-methylisocitrate lyase-like PEP mutase family enzyme
MERMQTRAELYDLHDYEAYNDLDQRIAGDHDATTE